MVLHNALGGRHTRIGDGAGRDAVAVEAGLVRRTVHVRPALDGKAGNVGVAFEAGGTAADRLVADGLAGGLAAAGQVTRTTHRPTFLVDTGVRVEAVVVHGALDLEAGHVRVALVAVLAGAHWLVLDDATEGVLTTGTWIHTDLVDARVSFATIIVCRAAGKNRRERLAARVVGADVAVGTGADHGSHRQGVDHRARGRAGARVEGFAEQDALAVEAGVLGRAVLVLDTLGCGDGQAGHQRVASEAERAAALSLVVSDKTVCIFSTWILVETRINTILISAGFVLRTLGVSATADDFTGNKRIPLVAGDTLTVGLVAGGVALGEPAARVLHQARVHALPVEAGLSVPAVVVALATNRLAGNQRISDVARRTGTNRSVGLYEALGIGPTITGVHALAVDAGLAVGTVVVPGAARRVRDLYGSAAGVGVGHPALATRANHCSKGQTIDYSTYGSDMAGRERETGVLAPFVEAGSVVGTVGVHPTLGLGLRHRRRLLGRAGDKGVANPAGRAHALGVVVLDAAAG